MDFGAVVAMYGSQMKLTRKLRDPEIRSCGETHRETRRTTRQICRILYQLEARLVNCV